MRITKNWKNILSIGLAVLVLFGAVGAVAAFATNDSKPAGAVFKVGGLDLETGKYVKTDKTIYTEKAIDAYGLRIEPDFESTVTYDIYYYDNEDKLLRVFDNLTDVYDQDFEVASKCRIVIHPEIPEDTKEKDFKVHFWDIAKYASMIKITVSKESNGINYENMYNKETLITGKCLSFNYDSDGKPILPKIDSLVDLTDGASTPVIEVDEGIDGVIIFAKLEYPPTHYGFFYLANEDLQCISAKSMTSSLSKLGDGWHVVKLENNELGDAKFVRACFDNIHDVEEVYIYTYND